MTGLLAAYAAGQSGIGAIEYGTFVGIIAMFAMFVVETVRAMS